MLVTGDATSQSDSSVDCSRDATPALAFGFPLFRFQGASSTAARASDDALVLVRLLAGRRARRSRQFDAGDPLKTVKPGFGAAFQDTHFATQSQTTSGGNARQVTLPGDGTLAHSGHMRIAWHPPP